MASIPPHIHTQPSEAEANPTPDPNQDAIARIPLARSPLAAFLGIICSLAALGSLWFGRSAVVVAAGLAAAGIVLAIIGWRSARRGQRPAGVAIAALAVGVIAVGIVVALIAARQQMPPSTTGRVPPALACLATAVLLVAGCGIIGSPQGAS